jgi:lactoylglutathione lyase
MGWAQFKVGDCFLGVERVAEGDVMHEPLMGRFVGVSLQVENIEDVHRELVERGVAFVSSPEKQPWGGVLAHFKDPEENVLTLLGGVP